jgi:hypothetical protein
MTRKEFNDRLAELTRAYATGAENVACHACRDCERCASCMFCSDCSGCYRCTHCVGCRDCSHCSHSRDSIGCHGCAYCVRSELCSGSNYLQNKDFHILNEPYRREAYFKITRELEREVTAALRRSP